MAAGSVDTAKAAAAASEAAVQTRAPGTVDPAVEAALRTARAVAEPAPVAETRPKVEAPEDVLQAAKDFNRAFTLFDIQAHFSVHEATGTVVVDVVDTRSGDVIREIPPRELLDRYAQLMDILGLLVDGRA
jgi:flagellar protein FlaG